MPRFLKYISGWFGYSRRERRSSLILLIIIFLVVILRFIPTGKSDLNIFSPAVIFIEPPLRSQAENAADTVQLSDFDPNIAPEAELIRLGMSKQQARTVIKYREKGGRFRVARDIRRIYGIDSALASRLMPFVKIEPKPDETKKASKPDTLRSYSRRKEIYSVTDLNSCDSAELERLPGIGPVLSARIIKYRDLLGGFWSVDQLSEVYGLSDSTLSLISKRVKADSSGVKKINLNKAVFSDLARHPYLERYDVQSILKFRAINGFIDSMPQLVQNRILTQLKASRLIPYFSFGK